MELKRKKSKPIRFAVFDRDSNKVLKGIGDDVFIAAIKKVGADQVEKLGIRGTNGYNLILRNESNATKPKKIIEGYYLNSQTSSYEKIADLYIIKDALNMPWDIIVEKVDKSVDDQLNELKK